MKYNFLILFISLLVPGHILCLPRLLIKIPTRSRPEQFFSMLDKYYQTLSEEIPYHFLISCDTDDIRMNCPEIIQRLSNYKNLTVRFSNNTTKVIAYNDGVSEMIDDFDIILVTSDDMEPVVHGYDKIIVEEMEKYFPDFDGTLNFNDGRVGGECNTYPILGTTYFKRFGYIYHPDYVSLFCDEELTIVANMLSKAVFIDRTLLLHRHPAHGYGRFDGLYQKNEAPKEHDRSLFLGRLLQNFELNQSQILLRKELIISPRNTVIDHTKSIITGKTDQPAFIKVFIDTQFIGNTETHMGHEWHHRMPYYLPSGPHSLQVIAQYKNGNRMRAWLNKDKPNIAFDSTDFEYQRVH